MANAVLNDLFGKKNKGLLKQATKKMVRSLKAPVGNYFGRLMKIGFKDSGKKDDDGNVIFRFFYMVVLLADEQGNEDCNGEQAYNTIDITANKKKTKAEMMAKALEVFDKLDYEAPDPEADDVAERIDADIAAILSEKPYVRINISQPDGYDRKFTNLNGTATQEEIEEVIGHALDDIDDVEDAEEPADDEPAEEPGEGEGDEEPGEPEPPAQTKPTTSRRTGKK